MKAFEEPRRSPWILLELSLAGLLIFWRCVAWTTHPLYFDFLLYLGLSWIFLVLCGDERAREAATLGLMLLFLGIYLKGVISNLLFVAGILPP